MSAAEGIALGFVLAWMIYPLALVAGLYLFDDGPARSPFDTCNCNRHQGDR